jgi:hypothetical protein
MLTKFEGILEMMEPEPGAEPPKGKLPPPPY